jgi:hypothetical protein
MALNEKEDYFTVLMYGLFSSISLQKSVRDQLEGIPATGIYYGLSWFGHSVIGHRPVERRYNPQLERVLRNVVHLEFVCCHCCTKNTRDNKVDDINDYRSMNSELKPVAGKSMVLMQSLSE